MLRPMISMALVVAGAMWVLDVSASELVLALDSFLNDITRARTASG